MSRHRTAMLALPFLVTAALACGDDNSPGGVSVTGSWSGVISFTSGRSTSMTLTQTGTDVSGTMTVAGAFIGNTFTGTVNGTNRTLEWEVLRDCESWGGTLTISASGDEMTGALLVDLSGCPSGSNASGTVSVTRQ